MPNELLKPETCLRAAVAMLVAIFNCNLQAAPKSRQPFRIVIARLTHLQCRPEISRRTILISFANASCQRIENLTAQRQVTQTFLWHVYPDDVDDDENELMMSSSADFKVRLTATT